MFDTAHTALLAMDCQNGIVSIYARPQDAFIERAARVLRSARKAGMRVIHIQVGFRPGMPEVGDRNQFLAAIKSSVDHQKFFQGAAGAIHAALGPESGDIVITKHRVSAFTGTDLDMILRANDIHTIVLFGIATSGVVLSTLLHATDIDYQVFVVGDCCADQDPALHDSLLNLLFPKRGRVISADDLVSALERA